MKKTTDHMDNTFRSAYEQYKEDPSSGVWDKINAGLDQQKMDSVKRTSAAWKRIAIILMLILTGWVLYDLNISTTIDGKGNKSLSSKEPASGSVLIAPPSNGLKQKVESYNKIPIKIGQQLKSEVVLQEKNNEKLIFATAEEYQLPLSANKKELPAAARAYFRPAYLLFDEKKISSLTFHAKERRRSGFVPYWTLDGIFSFGRVAYRIDSDLPANNQQVKIIRQRENHETSFSGGLAATYQLHRKFGLQTGITYSYNVIKIDPHILYAFQDPGGDISYKYVTSSGYAYLNPNFGNTTHVGDSVWTTEAEHKFQSVSIPLMARFRTGKGRFEFQPGLGMAANLVTKSKLETEIRDASNRESVKIHKLKGARSLYWSVIADAELKYRVNPVLSVNIRPGISYAITPITDNNVVESFPYNVGVGIGFTYKFKSAH